jgi:hypothetical protein
MLLALWVDENRFFRSSATFFFAIVLNFAGCYSSFMTLPCAPVPPFLPSWEGGGGAVAVCDRPDSFMPCQDSVFFFHATGPLHSRVHKTAKNRLVTAITGLFELARLLKPIGFALLTVSMKPSFSANRSVWSGLSVPIVAIL